MSQASALWTRLSRISLPIAVAALLLSSYGLYGALQGPAEETAAESTDDKAAFERRVRAYLLDNPEIIADAIRVLQRREAEARQQQLSAAAGEQWETLKSDSHSPVVGPENAPVTVVEFYDYRCSFCRRAYPDVARLLEEYDGDIRYVFKQFPVLDGVGETDGVSHVAARAAVAAAEQGLAEFTEFHDRMMRRDGQLTEARVYEYAAEAGLDVERLKVEMTEPSIQRYFDETLDLARRVGVSGTPTYVINGRVLAGAQGFEAMRELVEKGLVEG